MAFCDTPAGKGSEPEANPYGGANLQFYQKDFKKDTEVVIKNYDNTEGPKTLDEYLTGMNNDKNTAHAADNDLGLADRKKA